MKRSTGKWILFAAVACLVLAFAVPAIAATGGAPYVTWGSVSGLPGQGTSPHGGYSTSTVKCRVCHAVHNAGAGGELLLRSTVADACNYCHVGGAGGYTQVYGGNPANYSGTDFNNAHNSYQVASVEQGVQCTYCHQVHAADSVMSANAYLTTKLLIAPKTFVPFPQPNANPELGVPLSTDTSNTALTKFCETCHYTRSGQTYPYYTGLYNGQSHVMTAAADPYDNPAAGTTTRVAWNDSTQCSSCHNSQYTQAAWPHYTQGVRFLVSAGSAASSSVAATSTTQDGVCLRCHRDGAGSGIGLNY